MSPRAWRWIVLLLVVAGGCLSGGTSARAQNNNSLFPKGTPSRQLPRATPLPPGSLTPPGGGGGRRRQPPPPRPDTVALPYNLVWFDSQNRLASLFAGVSAKVTEKKTEGPNEIWTVKELIAPNLRTSFFTFQQGMLIGLEFDYGQDAWDTNKYNEVMGQFRRLLETKCEAPGEIISRKNDEVPNSTIKESLMGYQWVRGDTAVQLFYYSAEDTSKALAFRSISVHYRYRDPNAPPPGSEPPPGASPPPAAGTNNVPTQNDTTPGGALPMPDATPGGALPSPAPAVSPSPTPSPSPSPAESPAASPSPVASASPSPAASPGASPAVSPTPTPDASPAASPGPDSTPMPADTPAASPSPSPSPSVTPTPTPTPKPTPTPTPRRKKKH